MPLPEQVENEILFQARQLQAQASPLHSAPWISRLVANVVQTTLDLVEPHLTPVVKIPDRDTLARGLFVADNWRQPEAEALAEWADITEDNTREQYTHKLADAAIAAFRKANS